MITFRLSIITMPALAATFALMACSSISFDSTLFSDNAWIARESDSYRYTRRTQTGGATEAEICFSGFYGKHSVWLIESLGRAELGLYIDIAAGLDGRYKVCFVGADGEVIELENTAGSSNHSLAMSHGKQYIVVVGDAAYGSVALRLLEGQEPRSYDIRVLF